MPANLNLMPILGFRDVNDPKEWPILLLLFQIRRKDPFVYKGRPPDKSEYWTTFFSIFSTKTYVVGTQKIRLNETVLLSTRNTCLN